MTAVEFNQQRGENRILNAPQAHGKWNSQSLPNWLPARHFILQEEQRLRFYPVSRQCRTERHQSLWHEYEKLYVSNSNRNIWMSRSRAFLLARVRTFTAKNPFPCLPRAFNNRVRFFIVYLLRATKIASPNSMALWSHTFQDYKARWMLLHRESPQIRSRGFRNSKIFAYKEIRW
jgi:hypothetical protein